MTRLDVGISSPIHAVIGSREARRRRSRAERPARALVRGRVPAAPSLVEAAAGDWRWRVVRRRGAGAGRRRCAACDECEREPSHPSARARRARPQRTTAEMSLAAWAAPGLGRARDAVVGLAQATLRTRGLYCTQPLGYVLTPNANAKNVRGASAPRRRRRLREDHGRRATAIFCTI